MPTGERKILLIFFVLCPDRNVSGSWSIRPEDRRLHADKRRLQLALAIKIGLIDVFHLFADMSVNRFLLQLAAERIDNYQKLEVSGKTTAIKAAQVQGLI